jgi:hypothetical protein
VAEARSANALQCHEAARAKALQRAESEWKKAEQAFIRAQEQLMWAHTAPGRSSRQELALMPVEMVVGRQAGSRLPHSR